jgi:hypothetical protein
MKVSTKALPAHAEDSRLFEALARLEALLCVVSGGRKSCRVD